MSDCTQGGVLGREGWEISVERKREREPGLVVICLDPLLPSSRPALHEGQDGHHSTRMDIVVVFVSMSLSY